MEEIRIIGIGDEVERMGIIKEHSRFKHAVNFFTSSSLLLSVVSKNVGNGPNNIVLNLESFENELDINFCSNSFHIQGKTFEFKNCPVYNSYIEVNEEFDSIELLSNLNYLERIVINEASPYSSAFLLDNRRDAFFITPFEKKVRDVLRKEFDSFLKGDLSSISFLKGAGVGLTPQGDDLIRGAFFAILLYEKSTKTDFSDLKNRMLGFAKYNNLITWTSMHYLAKGKIYEKEKNLFYALTLDKNRIYSSAIDVLNQGETSGADFLTGFILTVRKLFQGGILWQ